MGTDQETGVSGGVGEGAGPGSGTVRLTGKRVQLEVRTKVILSGAKKRIISGTDINERVLQGVVRRIAPGVTVDVKIGDEVFFHRPEGQVPETAIMDQDLLLAVVSYPQYGES